MGKIKRAKKSYANMSRSSKCIMLYFGFVLFVFVSYTILLALHLSTHIDSYPANGTFQLYNPLRRLASGELAGHDFPFFHGIGVLLVHEPLFFILGTGVFAAEFVKWFVSPILFFAVSFFFFYAAFHKNLLKTIAATASFSAIALLTIDVVLPGNSLLGLRSLAPILIGALLLLPIKRTVQINQWVVNIKYILTPVLLGLSVLMGTEHGIGAIIAYLLILCVYLLFQKNISFMLKAAAVLSSLIIIALSTLVFATIFSGGHPVQTLHYALVDIPNEQGWYFGAPPNPYLTLNNALPILFNFGLMKFVAVPVLASLLVIGIGLRFLKPSTRTLFACSFILLGSLIAAVGGFMGYYAPEAQLIPFSRALTMVAVIVLINLIVLGWQKRPANTRNKNRRLRIVSAALGGILLVTISLYGIYRVYPGFKSFAIKDSVAKAIHAPFRDDKYVAGELWQSRMDQIIPHINKDQTLWSTYTSLYDSQLGKLNPSDGGEDYIIHALGKERRDAYENQFLSTKPDQVVTLKANYFAYEEWLWTRHWAIYKELFMDYRIDAESSTHLLWKRKQNVENSTTNEVRIPLEHTFTNTSNKPELYSITVDYSVKSGLPGNMLKKIPRYLIRPNGTSAQRYAISLPPYETHWSFPLIVMPGDKVNLMPYTDGIIESATLNISSISSQKIIISTGNTYPLMENYCFDNKHYLGKAACFDSSLQLKHYQ